MPSGLTPIGIRLMKQIITFKGGMATTFMMILMIQTTITIRDIEAQGHLLQTETLSGAISTTLQGDTVHPIGITCHPGDQQID